jgi:hypothetical protein
MATRRNLSRVPRGLPTASRAKDKWACGCSFVDRLYGARNDFAAVAGREWRGDVAAVSDRESGGAWRFPRHRRAGRVRRSIGGYVGCAHRRCCAPARRGPPGGRYWRGGGDAARHGQVRGASDRDVPLGIRDAAAAPARPCTTRRFHPNGPRQRTAHRTAARDPVSVPADGHDLRRLSTGVRSAARCETSRPAPRARRPRIRLPAMRPTRRPHQP